MPIVSRGHWLVTVLWVSLRRAGEESHADFRSIAEGFIKTLGIVAATTYGRGAAAEAKDYEP
jgi:hypothetical protein